MLTRTCEAMQPWSKWCGPPQSLLGGQGTDEAHAQAASDLRILCAASIVGFSGASAPCQHERN